MVDDDRVDRTQYESNEGNGDSSTNQGGYQPDDEFKAIAKI